MSLALDTALQFESGMRQKDVIGEWLPVAAGEEPTGVVLRGRRGKGRRRWANGLTWADLGKDLVICKETTKKGSLVSHDLKELPMGMSSLAQIPLEQRIGGLIIDETAGPMPSSPMPATGASSRGRPAFHMPSGTPTPAPVRSPRPRMPRLISTRFAARSVTLKSRRRRDIPAAR
jgi:hypothetical protein